MAASNEWYEGVKKLVLKLTSFTESSKRDCYNFMVSNYLVGYIKPKVLDVLRLYYKKYFFIDDDNRLVRFEKCYDLDFNSRSDAIEEVLLNMRERQLFNALKGWRDEKYNVSEKFYSEKVFKIERSAISLFGTLAYGCHMNGYVKDDNGVYKIWIARRSKTKQTFPGMLDNIAAGGLAWDLKIHECSIKELDEEAGINGELLRTLKSVDCITYAYEDEDGINREGEFVFDIKLPLNFVPINKDGEAESFQLMTIEEIKKAVISDDFKPNSALITINFLMRKGLITPDENSNYLYLLENMHAYGF